MKEENIKVLVLLNGRKVAIFNDTTTGGTAIYDMEHDGGKCGELDEPIPTEIDEDFLVALEDAVMVY